MNVRPVRAATEEHVSTNTEDISAFVSEALLATTVKEVSSHAYVQPLMKIYLMLQFKYMINEYVLSTRGQ